MKKSKKISAIILILIVIGIIGIITTKAVVEKNKTANAAKYKVTEASTTADGNFEYEVLSNGTIQITKYVGTGTVVTVPEKIDGKTVTEIDGINRCPNITRIEIPKGVTYITNSFWQCPSLEAINVASDNSRYYSTEGVLFHKLYSDSIMQYPKGKKDTEYTIPSGIASIGAQAFYECTNLKKVNIPETIINIGQEAFGACTNLTTVQIPSRVQSIAHHAFKGCTSLTSISIPNSVTNIGDTVFSGCTSLTSIEFPEKVSYLGRLIFSNSKIVKKVQVGTSSTQEIALPDIIKRAMETGDILYSSEGFTLQNCTLNTDKTKLIVSNSVLNEQSASLKVTSGALNGLTFEITKIDNVAPTCTITANKTSPTNASSITYTLTFSETVTGFAADDITVTNGTKGTFSGSGKTYTLVVTNSGSYTQTISIAAGVCTDSAGNGNTKASKSITIDRIAPTATGITLSATYTNTGKVTATANGVADSGGSEINRVQWYLISPANTRVWSDQASDNQWSKSIDVSSLAEGQYKVGMVLHDSAGNINDTTYHDISKIGYIPFYYDKTAPTCTITASETSPTNASSITYTFTFSEAVTGFTTGDVTVTNGTKGTFSGSGKTYTLVVTNSRSYTQTVSIEAGVCTDAAGNSNTKASKSITIDRTAPTCTITASKASPTNANSIAYTFTFSEAVTGFSIDDITVTNGTKGTLSGSGTTYTLPVTNSGSCTQTVSLAVGVCTDAAGNGNTTASKSIIIDRTSPTCTITANKTSATNASIITYTFTFSESVTGFTTDDIIVSNGTKETFTKSSEKVYTLEVTNGGSCTQTVSIDEEVCTDLVGNENTAASKSVIIDRTNPIAGTMTMNLGSSVGADYTNNTWTSENVYISLNNGSDAESGHKSTTYKINGGEETTEAQTLTKSGTYEIVVTTIDNVGNTATNSYTIKIRKPQSISVEANPKKVTYKAYEDFNAEGMIISINYDNGDIEETSEYTITNGECLTCNVSKIEIQYNKNSAIKTELPITVGHAETVDARVEPTCTETGLTEGKHCEVCNKVFVEQKEIPTLGHSFRNYISNNDATCTEDGTKTAKCDRCDETYTIIDEGSALGHNYESKVTATTCTEKGYTTHTCTRCKDSYIDTYTDALGHSFTSYISNNDATCTKDGTKTAKCDRCDETDTKADVGSKLSHNYENGKCTICGKEEPKIQITSKKYKIEETNISKIQTKMTIKTLKENLQTNATEIKVYNKQGEEQEENSTVATGMTIVFKLNNETRTLKLIVAGDVNGDGKADFKDIVSINKHRLNKKLLDGEYLKAGDVTEDNKSDLKDIVKINKFRLNKIVQLFENIIK